MRRALPILLIALFLDGCYTERLTTKDEHATDSPYTNDGDRRIVIVDPLPPPPPVIITEVPVAAEPQAPAPTGTRRDFGSTRGGVEQDRTGRSNDGGRTEGRGR